MHSKIDILHPVLHAYDYFASYTCIMYYLIHVYIAGGFEYVYEMVHFLFPNNKMMIMTRFDTVPSIADGVQHDLRSSS